MRRSRRVGWRRDRVWSGYLGGRTGEGWDGCFLLSLWGAPRTWDFQGRGCFVMGFVALLCGALDA
jgi:hypothetical protein